MLIQITNPSVSMMSFAQVELPNDLIQFLSGMFGCYLEYLSLNSVSTLPAKYIKIIQKILWIQSSIIKYTVWTLHLSILWHTLEEDMFLSIQYPSLHSFPKPYLHNWDFRDSDQALRYTMKYFNLKSIHESLKEFPDLSNGFIHSNTYVDFTQFNLLQHYQQINTWLKCIPTKTVRASSQILCIWH